MDVELFSLYCNFNETAISTIASNQEQQPYDHEHGANSGVYIFIFMT